MKSKPKNRIYISGPISGLDIKLAKQRFRNASIRASIKHRKFAINPLYMALNENTGGLPT